MSNFDNVLLYYHHPHIQTFVQNNTIRTEDLADVPGPIDSLHVILGGKGKDNVVQYFTNLPAFLEEHGAPNYALYGQAGYNVTETLRSNVAGAYVLRILPKNATHANVVILAKYKEVDENGTTKLEIKYESMVINEAFSPEEINLKMSELDSEEVDVEGYSTTPLMCLYVQGRGDYGSRYRARFIDATQYEDPDNIYKTYRIDVMEMDKTLIRKESLFGTIDPVAFDSVNKQSLYLEDIINDPETGSGKVHVMMHEYGFQKMLDTYNTIVPEPIELREFDPILGKTMDGKTDEFIKFVAGDAQINLDSIDGFAFNGGSDGDFSTADKSKSQLREQMIEETYIKAFNGELDRTILSRFSTPILYMLDANHTDDVKRAMAQLNMSRGYDMCYLDSGLLNTVQDTVNWGETIKNVAGTTVLKEMHHYKVRDLEYTGKTIPMTITNYMAYELPIHLKNKGLGEPFAMSNATIRNMVKGSFKPTIDPNDHEIKKQLYALRINCFETVKYNVYQRTTAITSDAQLSDLSDEFNVYILNKAVVICENILREKLYKLAEPADRVAYQKDANRKLQFELGGLVRSATVEFKMSPRDESQNILRLALRLVFKTIVKRGIVEIYIDPRAVSSN